MRRRFAVTLAVLAALVGEWLGHSLNYYRVAGVAGLQSALTSGIHDYMLPLGLALLVAAALGAASWTRAWLSLSRRLDRSAVALGQLLRDRRPAGRGQCGGQVGGTRQGGAAQRMLGQRGPAPSFAARVIALAAPMGALQCSLYLGQENLERAVHGMSGSGLAPLVDSYGAAAWTQAVVAVVLAAALVAASRVLRSKHELVESYERLVGVLWQRALRGASSPPPRPSHLLPTALVFRSCLWGRPPPVLTAT